MDEPQLALFLGGSPQAQLGWEQLVLEVVHLTLDWEMGQDEKVMVSWVEADAPWGIACLDVRDEAGGG